MVDVVFLLVRVRIKGARRVPQFMQSTQVWPNQGQNADWLTGKTEHWLADQEVDC